MLTIYGVPISVHTRKAVVAAIYKGLDHKVEPVLPFNPAADWRDLSPTGLIPALTDDGFSVADSTAITMYLENRYPDPSLLPDDAQSVARVFSLNAYAGDYLFRNLIHGIFFNKIIRPNILNEPADPDAIETIIRDVQPGIFGFLDSQAKHEFLVGDCFTLADVAIASNLVNYRYLGFDFDETLYPDLARYAHGIFGHSTIQAALQAERPFAEQMGLDLSWLGETVVAT